VTIPSEKKELDAMIDRIEESLELKIKKEKENREKLDSSSKEYKEACESISQLQSYYYRARTMKK